MNNFRLVSPGRYYHFGLESWINYNFQPGNPLIDKSQNTIKIAVGIDGLPISKSTSHQFWPILGYIVVPNSNAVFPIGIYLGTEKPTDSNDFIFDLVSEAKQLIQNGITINNKLYKRYYSFYLL